MCNLYKDTFITIRVNGNIFYGPIKMMWQTFHDKVIEVFYDGKWFPAKIIGETSEKSLIKIRDHFICSFDLKLKTPSGDIQVSKTLNKIFKISFNDNLCESISSSKKGEQYYFGYTNDKIIDEKSDWLFGIEFEDPNNQYYTLTDGFIVSTK